jgi:hypothetical protein
MLVQHPILPFTFGNRYFMIESSQDGLNDLIKRFLNGSCLSKICEFTTTKAYSVKKKRHVSTVKLFVSLPHASCVCASNFFKWFELINYAKQRETEKEREKK